MEEPAEEAPAEEPPPEQEPLGAEKEKRSIGPVILGAAGLVGLGVGTGFGVKALGHDNTARGICEDELEECTDNQVAEWEGELDSAQSSATIAYIGWGVGGAALAGAVIWYIVDTPSTASDSQSKVKLTPLLGARSWGLGAQGTF